MEARIVSLQFSICYGSGVMDVARGSYPQKISVYNKGTVTDGLRMYRRMEPFIAGKAEEWIIKVTGQTPTYSPTSV